MGGGSTFVDGVRRLFHRRSTTTTITTSVHSNGEPILNNLEKPIKISDSQEEGELTIIEDFDISGLKLIKVPKRVDFPFSSASYSMDSHKKVWFLHPFLTFYAFWLFDVAWS